MKSIITNRGVQYVEPEALESLVLQSYNDIKSAYQPKENKIITYFSELNGKSIIPDHPDTPEESWRSNFRSSMFYQKTIYAYLLLRSLLQQTSLDDLYNIYTENPNLTNALNKIAKTMIFKTKTLDELDKSIFYALFSGYFMLKCDLEPYVDEFGDLEEEIKVEAINPIFTKLTSDELNFAIDKYIPIQSAQALMRMGLWRNIENLTPYNYTTEKDRTDSSITSNTGRKSTVKVTEVYTRLILEDGSVSDFYKFIIINDKHLVYEEPINHADKRPPFIFAWFYGTEIQQSFADMIFEYYKEDTRLTRQMLDLAIVSSSIGIEVDVSNLDSDGQDELVVFSPFSVVKKRTPDPAITNFKLGSFDPNILPIRQLLLQEAQNITGITEFLMGQPTSKGRPTAREVLIKTQASMQMINTIVRRMEDALIKPLVQKLLSLAVQYKLDEMYKILSPEEIQAVQDVMREGIIKGKAKTEEEAKVYLIKQIYKGIEIKVGGLTQSLDNMAELEKLMQLVGIYAQYGLTPFLDMPNITKELLNRMRVSSEYARVPTREELAMLTGQQQQNQNIEDSDGDEPAQPNA